MTIRDDQHRVEHRDPPHDDRDFRDERRAHLHGAGRGRVAERAHVDRALARRKPAEDEASVGARRRHAIAAQVAHVRSRDRRARLVAHRAGHRPGVDRGRGLRARRGGAQCEPIHAM
jgi:hypothetical protein